MTKLEYLLKPLASTFTATIIRKQHITDGRMDIWLDKTLFYPTGGGQPHDTGTLNNIVVVDVFKDEVGNVVHRLAGDPDGPDVTGQIDVQRRRGHMQHHSAQHILSAAVFKTFGLNTLSARISASTPSTIDIPDTNLSWQDMHQAERAANEVIFSDRPIMTYFISDADATTKPFRRPPKVTGQIRVVEVTDFDYSACGGTHCPSAGMIGSIKIIKMERQNKKLRLYFVAGEQALAFFQLLHHIITEVGHSLSAGPEDVIPLVQQQVASLKQLQKDIRGYRQALLPLEADGLAAEAVPIGSVRLVTTMFHDRSPEELRELARLLQQKPNVVAFLASHSNNKKLSLVVSCAEESSVKAVDLLRQQLEQVNGRGGGDARLAQGGGAIDANQVKTFYNNTARLVSVSDTKTSSDRGTTS
jgi:alanyl-tRNA synthetase